MIGITAAHCHLNKILSKFIRKLETTIQNLRKNRSMTTEPQSFKAKKQDYVSDNAHVVTVYVYHKTFISTGTTEQTKINEC